MEIKTITNAVVRNKMTVPIVEKENLYSDLLILGSNTIDKTFSMGKELRNKAILFSGKASESFNAYDITARKDEEYEKAFHRTTGWTGADGTYSVPLSDGRTVWLFGDTLIDTVLPSGAHTKDTLMINNSIALQQGRDPSTIKFITGGTENNAASFFTPPDGKGWFWVHDAVPDRGDGKIVVFLDQIEKSGEGVFGFRQTATWTAEVEVKKDQISVKNYKKIPHFREAKDGMPTTAFGASVLTDGEWTYIYGTQDYGYQKDMVVARKPSGTENDEETAWEFFSGDGWSNSMDDIKPICNDVGNELSVHRTVKGTYVLTSQKGGFDPEIYVKSASMPEGPWSSPRVVWKAPEAGKTVLTYNAKAHPELSDRNQGLLISYNVNATTSEAIMEDANIYRPRFIRVGSGQMDAQ
ncbi:MAG: DUF5005 domain-containing protein [Candidatus Xenobiia bacterium LiM19]